MRLRTIPFLKLAHLHSKSHFLFSFHASLQELPLDFRSMGFWKWTDEDSNDLAYGEHYRDEDRHDSPIPENHKIVGERSTDSCVEAAKNDRPRKQIADQLCTKIQTKIKGRV